MTEFLLGVSNSCNAPTGEFNRLANAVIGNFICALIHNINNFVIIIAGNLSSKATPMLQELLQDANRVNLSAEEIETAAQRRKAATAKAKATRERNKETALAAAVASAIGAAQGIQTPVVTTVATAPILLPLVAVPTNNPVTDINVDPPVVVSTSDQPVVTSDTLNTSTETVTNQIADNSINSRIQHIVNNLKQFTTKTIYAETPIQEGDVLQLIGCPEDYPDKPIGIVISVNIVGRKSFVTVHLQNNNTVELPIMKHFLKMVKK